MNPLEMVVIIVAMAMIAGVLKAKYGSSRHRRGREEGDEPVERAETLRLREEVKMLKDRLHVLERITTEKESSLSREIDELRDR